MADLLVQLSYPLLHLLSYDHFLLCSFGDASWLHTWFVNDGVIPGESHVRKEHLTELNVGHTALASLENVLKLKELGNFFRGQV